MGHKRKREVENTADSNKDSTERAPKREKTNGTAAADRRQKRSERKSKKAQQAQDNASQNKSAISGPEIVQADPDTPADTLNADFIPLTNVADAPAKKTKSDKNDKKNRKQQVITNNSTTNGPSEPSNSSTAKRPSRSSHRKEVTITNEDSTDPKSATSKTTPTSTQNSRFICFVGNLPYSCTTDQLQAHFRKLAPTSIRLATDKSTGKPKGFAFLEFDQYDKMKTCLKVYHHSLFDPDRPAQVGDELSDNEAHAGQRGKGKGRRINVELTAGGGGGGEKRKEKIKGKNEKLTEERARRKLAEEKAEYAKRRKAGGGMKSAANAIPVEVAPGDIHPSRLRRVPH